MRILIVHSESSTGAYYLLFCLVSSIAKYYPNANVSVLLTKGESYVKNNDIDSYIIFEPPIFKRKKYFHIKLLDNIINHFRKKNTALKIEAYIKKIQKDYDVVLYSWFYTMEPLNIELPSFFLLHDLITTHFFGYHIVEAYNSKDIDKLKKHIQKYISRGCIPCFTSDFVKQDFLRLFPHYNGKTYVVWNAFERQYDSIDSYKIKTIIKQYNISNEYIILPINNMLHKNMRLAMSGYFIAKQKYPNLKMIICGYGLSEMNLKMDNEHYATHIDNTQDYDIKILGFVDDEILSILIKNALLLINTSLCEAACGSGLDAWLLGTPTAISNIPPYIETVQRFGVKTEFFNPSNSNDIAKAILNILDNPKKAQKDAEYSKDIIAQQCLYKKVADSYIKMFNEHTNQKDKES